MADFISQFRDHYRLITAEILYHFPDHPKLLQTYLWQDYDLAPKFPVLHGFLAFWTKELDGKLHSVNVAETDLITAGDYQYTDSIIQIH